MKELLYFDLKKILQKKVLFVVAVLLLVVNVYNICNQFDMFHFSPDKEYNNACYEMYSMVKGKMTYEKINSFKEYMDKMQKASVSEEKVETYLDTPMSDYNQCEYIYSDIQRIYGYNEFISELKINNNEYKSVVRGKNNIYKIKLCNKIDKTYADRNISAYYNTENFERYFNYNFSSFLVLCLVLLFVSPVFSGEAEEGILSLLRSTKSGRKKLTECKVLSSLIAVSLIFSVFYISDLFCFIFCQRLEGFSNPIYSITSFACTPLDISIGGYIFLVCFLKLCAFIVIALITMVISSLSDKNIVTFSLSFIIMLVSMFICAYGKGASEYLNMLNPVLLLTINEYITDFSVINLFGFPVLKYHLIILGTILSGAFCSGMLILINNKNTIRRKKGKGSV